jgi:FtsH-binding integral membrane protein
MVNTALYNTLTRGMTGGRPKQSIDALINSKKHLMVATFANLLAQLGITYYVMTHTKVKKEKQDKMILLKLIGLLLFQLLLITCIFLPMESWKRLLCFSILSVSYGVILSYLTLFISPDIIKLALLGTGAIFASMFSIGLLLILSGIELGYQWGLFLFFSLLFYMLFHFFARFYNVPASHKTIMAVGILIFSLYIVYDTNQILQRNYYGDFITASVDYYLDIINIFVKLTSYLSDN